MKLLLCGCLHGKVHSKLRKSARQCDAVLCAGDLVEAGATRKMAFDEMAGRKAYTKKQWRAAGKETVISMKEPLGFFRSLDVPVFVVAGNNDHLRALEHSAGGNVKLLKSKTARFQGIEIAGLSYQYIQRIDRFIRGIRNPKKTILLTHDVPYGVFDMVKWKKSPAYGRHVGEPLINAGLRRKKLLAYICAHMHEYQGMKILHGTPVINTGYGRIGRHAVMEIDGGVSVEFIR